MELKAIKAYLPSFEADHNEILLVSHTKENYAPAKQIECYLKSEADKAIAEKDKEIAELKEKMDSIKVKFREFNDNVCKKIVDASRTMSAISQDSQMDFYEEFIKEADK